MASSRHWTHFCIKYDGYNKHQRELGRDEKVTESRESGWRERVGEVGKAVLCTLLPREMIGEGSMYPSPALSLAVLMLLPPPGSHNLVRTSQYPQEHTPESNCILSVLAICKCL